MSATLDVTHVVVGAGAVGMAFTDALVAHSDARVALVDRRDAPGGHWLDAYPFVRLHQASSFYGVASTLLGGDRVQQQGPEAGLLERASGAEVRAYYERVLTDVLLPSGRVTWLPRSEWVDGQVVSQVSGRRWALPATCRVVDARYLSPRIPVHTPPPFEVGEGAHVVPVNDLVALEEAPSQYVVVGSGKTATDAVVWLLDRGVDPDAVCWVRPRDPWMLDRARVQPVPEVFLGMVADVLQAGAEGRSLDEVFLRLEDAGVMTRLDRAVTPTMARAPTLGRWELELLRSVEHVVRRGHVRRVDSAGLHFDDGSVALAPDAVVVHCAAEGLRHPPLVDVWRPSGLTLQPVRSGFPCFNAALVGVVEATRDSDAEKNRLCPPSPFGGTLQQWAQMTVRGARASALFGAEADIRDWGAGVPLNPARVPPGHPPSTALDDVRTRLERWTAPALANLDRLST